ncbi:MAG: hypothetical protein IJF97_01460 [Eggerthellaceae bacterium]|nr:hypothetical protein [Eggerthellaceae bacterium]
MRVRKNALLLFSKVPEPGLVKTRLTRLKDGIFKPEVASALYHCMFFDVVEICCAALSKLEAQSKEYIANGGEVLDTYELIISTTPPENIKVMHELFEESGTWPRELVIIADTGASFDEHYNDSFNQAWERGAECILSMGADMPALTERDVINGFNVVHELDELPQGGIVLSPDQAMGVSIVGWPRKTNFDHTGVYYNPTGLTVLPAYIQKARERELPVRYIPAVPDIDTMGDLMHNVTLVEALNYCAPYDNNTPPWRTADALKQIGWDRIVVPPNDLHDPREHIDTEDSASGEES